MIELERTFLAKKLPKDLINSKSKEIIDLYLPASDSHPTLRIRKSGDSFEITKKVIVSKGDASVQKEHTISLTEKEFNSFLSLDAKKLRKIRYYYNIDDKTAEIDVFQDALKGLVVIEFEFNSVEEKDSFIVPDFCLVDVTQEKFIAGGVLAGKSYSDIESELKRFGYSRLS